MTCDLVQFLRHGVALHTEFGGSLIHQVDSLVWQESVGDVTFRKFDSCDAGVILNTNLVMVLITLLDASENADGVHLVRLVDHYGLEATFQSLILLEVFLILVEGGGADGSQLATCQCRLQNIGSIHGTFSAAGTYQGVNLVDEEDNLSVGVGHFLDDALQSLFELTFIFSTSYQCAHVERIELLVLQVLRYVATYDSFCKSFYDSGFTSTWLTDKDWVVFRSS